MSEEKIKKSKKVKEEVVDNRPCPINENNRIFTAKPHKGNFFKILFDSLNSAVSAKVHMKINSQGISIKDTDPGNTILFNCNFDASHFQTYFFSSKSKGDELNISFCVKQALKQMKNVKKKDSVTLFIENEKSIYKDHIGVLIQPENVESNRFEVNYFVYQEEPECNFLGLPDDEISYDNFMEIDSNNFQKIKKILSSCKKVNLKIQHEKYLLFSSGEDQILPSELGFGYLDKSLEFYESVFYSNNLNMIIKLPGLCKKMAFYYPSKDNLDYPIKVSMNVNQNNTDLGEVSVYIKNSRTIDSFNKQSEDYTPFIEEKPKKKNKKY